MLKQTTRHYVSNSSYFDTHPYEKEVIAKAVRNAGGKNVRFSYHHGWKNQPHVVTFDSVDEGTLKRIQEAVQKAVGTQWIIIREQDWRNPILETLGVAALSGVGLAAGFTATKALIERGKKKTNPTPRLVDSISHGDRVTIIDRFGQKHTGKAVMRSSAGGWVLNMGGAHGTPGLADDSNVVKVVKGKKQTGIPYWLR
jgi:hypothetical protein